MDSMTKLYRTTDGRPIIAGCQVLPPIETDERFDSLPPKDKQQRSNNRREVKHVDRFVVLNAFVDCSMAQLSKAEVATWLVLYRDTRSGTATTSQADIARRIGASDRTVRNAIKRLGELGLLLVVRRGGLAQGPSKYRVAGIGHSARTKPAT